MLPAAFLSQPPLAYSVLAIVGAILTIVLKLFAGFLWVAIKLFERE